METERDYIRDKKSCLCPRVAQQTRFRLLNSSSGWSKLKRFIYSPSFYCSFSPPPPSLTTLSLPLSCLMPASLQLPLNSFYTHLSISLLPLSNHWYLYIPVCVMSIISNHVLTQILVYYYSFSYHFFLYKRLRFVLNLTKVFLEEKKVKCFLMQN